MNPPTESIHDVVQTGDASSVEWLVETWEKEEKDIIQLLSHCSDDGLSPLHIAVANLDFDVTKILLEKGAMVNQRALHTGATALFRLSEIISEQGDDLDVRRKSTALIQILLEYGGDPTIIDNVSI